MPSVAWVTKLLTKTVQSKAAHQLVRGLVLHCCMVKSTPLIIGHVAGTDNVFVNIASHLIPQIDDDSAYPHQCRYWHYYARSLPRQLSNMILVLHGQCLTMQLWILRSVRQLGIMTKPLVHQWCTEQGGVSPF